MMETRFWVYVMGGAGTVIYIGVTNELVRRVWEHKTKANSGFTAKYNLDKLLFYAEFRDPNEAIAYEKKLKGWVRRRKDALIDESNAERKDLAADWFDLGQKRSHSDGAGCPLAGGRLKNPP